MPTFMHTDYGKKSKGMCGREMSGWCINHRSSCRKRRTRKTCRTHIIRIPQFECFASYNYTELNVNQFQDSCYLVHTHIKTFCHLKRWQTIWKTSKWKMHSPTLLSPLHVYLVASFLPWIKKNRKCWSYFETATKTLYCLRWNDTNINQKALHTRMARRLRTQRLESCFLHSSYFHY